MPRRPEKSDPELLRAEVVQLLQSFENQLKAEDLRAQVLHLVRAFRKMRALGSSLIPINSSSKRAAKDRILQYFRKYVGEVLHSDEFLVVSGIQEYARRIRELRVEEGWPIVSGKTARELAGAGELLISDSAILKPDSYLLLADKQDRDAAHRWHLANSIRKEKELSLRSKLLTYFRKNVGQPVTGEELSYLTKGAAGWPRRIRELRTEEGWPIRTKNTGRPDLPIGTYVLEEDRQSRVHDRHIPDSVQVEVLKRDDFRCIKCGWSYEEQRPGDPRQLLELHHIRHHVHGGENLKDNLATLCNVHHDEVHKLDKQNKWSKDEFFEWVKG